MAKFDVEYLKLCKKILSSGVEVENRTGMNTIKIPSYVLEFDLTDEFPILTTKQVAWRNAIIEMLWFYQAQSNDVRWLQERGNHIWDGWKIDENGKWTAMQNVIAEDGKLVKKEVVRQFPVEYAHTIGTAYGYIVKKFQLTQKLISAIKNNPTDRRMVMSLWQNDYLDTAVLPSCVWNTMWDVTNNELSLIVNQRSCDVPLGLPFNVTQYASLAHMIAQDTNTKATNMMYVIKDAHIYVDQIEGIEEQIKRGEELEDIPAPTFELNKDIKDFFMFDNSKELKDVKMLNYRNHGKINFPIAK